MRTRRDDIVYASRGMAWWFTLLVGVAFAVVGGLELAGVLASVAGSGPGHAWWFVVLGIGGGVAWGLDWRRVGAGPDGLVLERLGRRRVVPWHLVAPPRTRGIEPDLLYNDPHEVIGYGSEPSMHVNTLATHDGRVLCRLGPIFTNRTAFMIAVHRQLRALEKAKPR